MFEKWNDSFKLSNPKVCMAKLMVEGVQSGCLDIGSLHGYARVCRRSRARRSGLAAAARRRPSILLTKVPADEFGIRTSPLFERHNRVTLWRDLVITKQRTVQA